MCVLERSSVAQIGGGAAQEFNSSVPSVDAQKEGRPVMHELLPLANPGDEGEAQNLVCLSDEKGKETATML